MANIVARVGVYGDPHLCSKNYGAHRDYAKESLCYFGKIVDTVRDEKLTHLIGAGDFSYGRFSTLEYREAVDGYLEEIKQLTNGNHYELKGNHDVAGYGQTERDYYINKKLLRPSTNLMLGSLNISMVDYGKTKDADVIIMDDDQHTNFIVAHDFYKFAGTQVANFGAATELDHLEKWFGADCLICGHVHKIMDFSGYIAKGDNVHELKVMYPGCMMRPSYREGYIDTEGQIIIITVFDDGGIDLSIKHIELWDLADSFNLQAKEKEKAKKVEKAERVDISDVVKQLDSHDRNVGNPEDIIRGMKDVDDKYKNKAIDLLKTALG